MNVSINATPQDPRLLHHLSRKLERSNQWPRYTPLAFHVLTPNVDAVSAHKHRGGAGVVLMALCKLSAKITPRGVFSIMGITNVS